MSQEINLYQPIFRREKVVFSAVTLLGLVLGFAVLFYAYAVLTNQRVDALNSELEQRLAAEQGLTEQLRSLQASTGGGGASEDLELQIEASETRLLQLRNGREVLRNEIPEQSLQMVAPLIALGTQHPSGLWLTEIELAENGAQMSLGGRALRAERLPVFLENLQQEQALQGLSFRTLSVSAQPDGDIRFRVSTRAEGPSS